MACGLGAMVMLLFTALTPLGQETGVSNAVNIVTLHFEYDHVPAKPGHSILMDLDQKSHIVVFEQVRRRGEVVQELVGAAPQPVDPLKSRTVWISALDSDPEVTVSWNTLEFKPAPVSTRWSWTVSLNYARRIDSHTIRWSLPPLATRPDRIILEGVRDNGERVEPGTISLKAAVQPSPEITIDVGRIISVNGVHESG